jgi:GlcNAc-P-P-Und epimerase
MKVLVTGSSGFIGGHLAVALALRGDQVLGLDIRTPAGRQAGVEFHQVDLLDASGLRKAIQSFAPEVILHLAARTDLAETEDLNGYAANIDGVQNLAAAIRAAPSVRRCICTSTQLVCRMGYQPRHERDFCPTTLYGASKVQTEEIWREEDGGGVEWCLVRPTTIWGPGMYAHYLTLFRMIRDGWYFHVGSGPTWKSYGYVGNTVAQYLKLADVPSEQIHRRILYLADYEPLALEAWTEEFQRAMDAPPIKRLPRGLAVAGARVGDVVNRLGVTRFPFNSFRLSNVITHHRVDLTPTEAVCGSLPYSVAEGVAATVGWLNQIWRVSPEAILAAA